MRQRPRSVNKTSAMAITASDPAMRTDRGGHSDRLDDLGAAINPEASAVLVSARFDGRVQQLLAVGRFKQCGGLIGR